ncbi:hypothetical protein A9Q84_11990 [Halobacteriovorax marinus]|uniref:Response regulatory domain-containing protein n=1 Tax=Halobacteriovorax marinus TaxID=97084 RepID=A0A1Y5F7Z3_9BACT|nr:hypothetical protein A9Q84_11990 [Halobacteriovorax marinus]
MKVLFVDDDPNIINLYSIVLESIFEDGGVFYSYTPEDAKRVIQEQGLDLVISDFDMAPNGTGEEVYSHWSISNNRNNQFVFFTSRESTELEFYKLDENRHHIRKPTSLKEFKNFLLELLNPERSEYTPIAIYHFIRWNETKIPIYISLNSNHYVKIFNSNEIYSSEQLNKYIAKGMKFLYIKTADENDFLTEYDQSSLFNQNKSKKVDSYEAIKKNHLFLNAQISSFGLTKQSLKTAQATTENLINDIKKEDKLYNLLAKALNAKDFSYDHSYMTICIASFLCEQMNIDSINLSKVSTAALLHDIMLLNNKITYIHDLEPKKINQLNIEEKESIKHHQILDDELEKLDQFGSDISDIISFHHSGDEDYPFAGKKDLSQLNNLQAIFQASHFVSCEIYRCDFDFGKVGDILTLSQYKYSGKNFDKIWHTMQYVFSNKLN